MKAGKVLSIAILGALVTACSSSSGGGGNAIRPNPTSSLSEIPEQYRNAVSEAKTIPLYEESSWGNYQETLDGKTGKTAQYNYSDLPNGRSDLPISGSYEEANGDAYTLSGTQLVYQQPYSVVTGTTWTTGSGAIDSDELNTFFADRTLGFSTPTTALASLVLQNAIFNYKGVAFDGKEQATLNYTMNFGSQKGQGSIEGFTRTGLITLEASDHYSNNSGGSIFGDARSAGGEAARYQLSFFGPNAEELAGNVYDSRGDSFLGDSGIIFAGKRD